MTKEDSKIFFDFPNDETVLPWFNVLYVTSRRDTLILGTAAAYFVIRFKSDHEMLEGAVHIIRNKFFSIETYTELCISPDIVRCPLIKIITDAKISYSLVTPYD